MSNIPKLKITGEMNANKVISDDITTVSGETYITKETADELYKSKSDGTSSSGAVVVSEYDYTPAQEQKIQFSLNEPYTVMMTGWFVVNPEPSNLSESWTISIDDRVMFHSDNDGNMTVSTLVKTGQVITSNATSSKIGYFMPCKPELRDWRDSSLKSDTVDIWKNAVTTDNQVVDQWLDNTSSSSSIWDDGGYTYSYTLSYIKNDEAFDEDGNHLFYIQTENIRTGYEMFHHMRALKSFSGDLSSLTDGESMFRGVEEYWYMGYYSALESFSSDLSSLTNGESMFRGCINLTSFNCDMPKLTNGTDMFYDCDSLTSFSGNLSSLTNGTDMFMSCDSLTSFSGDLSSLTNGDGMFYNCTNLTSFSGGDMPSLTNGRYMFAYSALASFSGDLSSLTDGYKMFYHSSLESFSGDLSSLTNGEIMFTKTALESFNSDLSSLTNGDKMFWYCSSLESFNSNLSSLTNGEYMFNSCSNLTTFDSDLSSLTNGSLMFIYCKLNLESVQNIASTINDLSDDTDDGSAFWGFISIGIQSSLQGNTDLTTALNAIESKGWTLTIRYY